VRRRGFLGALVALCTLPAGAAAAERPLGDGAWSWFGDPRAITHDGMTYVGWVDREGDIKVSSYDHVTGERVTAQLAARLNRDDHANPSIHVRPDGRLVVFYSRHVGPAMHLRVSTSPGDVSSWGAPQTVLTNTSGVYGYTYPNPIRLEAENRTYLFWRGGNYNPTYAVQDDGSSSWSTSRNFIVMPGERPYAKYAESGGNTIHVAYTNAHPNEFASVNLHYVRIRGGVIERANGDDVGSLGGAPIHPTSGDVVFDQTEPCWVHDVAADSSGNPVIVFASFPSAADHRYWYARWTGSAWVRHQITAAGGTFREDGGSPYYSGGLTLDHDDPSRVYLSRQDGAGFRVETWTTADGGATWSSAPVAANGKNVRPVSPRGFSAFSGDLSVVWMNGSYPNYVDYATTIMGVEDGTLPPVANSEAAVRAGPAPLEVRFDGSTSRAPVPGGQIVSWQWDFGDSSTGSGEHVTHSYTAGGRYFPRLTVTDAQGQSSSFVDEIAVDVPTAPTAHTGGSNENTVHGAVDPENQATSWRFEYGPTIEYGATTPVGSLGASNSLEQVSTPLAGLTPGRLYHYRLVADNGSGSSEGEDRVMIAGRARGSDAYRDAVLATPGLAAYWRLGDLSGSTAREELGWPAGAYEGRFLLGARGVLGPLGDTAAGFDGASGGMAGTGPALAGSGTMEGWFRWRAGTAVMRDNTGPSGGWLLPFNSNGELRYRVGGQGFVTGLSIDAVRDGRWHHLVARKAGGAAALFVDGVKVHEGAGAGSTAAALPWHVMRNGTNAVFAEGEADEVALYTAALSDAEIARHYAIASALAAEPLPPDPPKTVPDPPAAGSGLGGGVLGGGVPTARVPASGSVSVRRRVLVARGAPATRNRLSARRRGRVWVVSDAAARLRPGSGCRRRTSRSVTCPAAKVRQITLIGGAGADRLEVRGAVRSVLIGGAGNDVLTGGRLARFRGGPGVDRTRRL
jgi:BNR repeat-containing family member/PKD domain/Concanavalin A-like lectin/glucanases superfamily